KPIYSIDTNVLMDWQARYYPTDIFPSLLVKMDSLINEGRLIAPAIVREELQAIGTNELCDWAKARKHLFVPTGDVLQFALNVLTEHPDLADPKAMHDEADPYVIGLAQMRGCVVVTQETSAKL